MAEPAVCRNIVLHAVPALLLLLLNQQTMGSNCAPTIVTVHEKSRYIGHFGGNGTLTELKSMQTAE